MSDRAGRPHLDELIGHDQTRMLVAIAESGSFSAAASRLGISQPAVSQQVKRLEDAAGRRLFRRLGTGVGLTHAGEAVLIYARAMLKLGAGLRRHFEPNGSEVLIRVGMSEDFCRTALPSVLWVVSRAHPNIRIRLLSGTYEMLSAAISGEEVDLAVLRRTTRLDTSRPLWTDQLVWIGRPDLPQPLPDPVPLVLPIAPNPARDVVLETLRAAGRSWQVLFEGISLAGNEAAIQAGFGVCAAPASMRMHDIAALPPEAGLPALPSVEFVMIGPAADASAPVRAFAELLETVASSSFRTDPSATAGSDYERPTT